MWDVAVRIVERVLQGIKVTLVAKLAQTLSALDTFKEFTIFKETQIANLLLERINLLDLSDLMHDYQ